MDFGKIFAVCKMPLLLVVVVNVVLLLINYGASYSLLPRTGTVSPSYLAADTLFLLIIVSVMSLANAALYVWTGYSVSKNLGSNAFDGAVGAVMVFAIACTLMSLLNLIITSLIFASMFPADNLSSSVFLQVLLVLMNYLPTIAIGIPANFVLGAIGGYVATKRTS